ncbi:hypothetical protein EC968_002404 [Mortierella alpina]|nr:hypothetical protein EC968_002404 [Mortierella alpina]
MPPRRSTTAPRRRRPQVKAGAKRPPSPDRTAIVLETTPAKRLRTAATPVAQTLRSTAIPDPDSIQAQQSGLVTDDGALSPADSEDSDLNVDMEFEDDEDISKKVAKVPKQRGPRGKYKPREGKQWAGQFTKRRPSALDGGSRATSTRNESAEVETPGDQERSQRSASETPSISSPRSKEREWYPDPPMMEYPYLQHSFPFHEYETPPNRVDTSDFGGTPQPLSDDWYRPQGSVAGEDLFTQEKLHYSLTMTKKIEVDSDNLRMDVYFQRGFELATRRMLDRIRAKNRLEEIRNEAQQAGRGEDHFSEPIKDPPRVYREPHSTDGQQDSEGQTDVSSDDEDVISTQASATNPPNVDETSGSTDALNPTTTVSETETSTSAMETETAMETEAAMETEVATPETDARKRRMDAGTTPTLTDYYQVNAFMASLFIPGEAQPIPETPLSSAACRILQTLLLNLETKMIGMGCHFQRQELTRRLALIETLQSGTGAHDLTPAPWRRNQRQSSAPAEDADADTAMASSSAARTGDEDYYISPYRRLMKCDMDDYVLHHQPGRPMRGRRKHQPAESTPSLDAGPSTTAGTEAETLVAEESPPRRPFISNPLEIPPAMEPFWKARDYMERQAWEERIRAAAEEAQRRQPRATM